MRKISEIKYHVFVVLYFAQLIFVTSAVITTLTPSDSQIVQDFTFTNQLASIPRADDGCEFVEFTQNFPFFGIDYSSVFVRSSQQIQVYRIYLDSVCEK